MDSLDPGFLLFIGFIHVTFTYAMWLSLRQLAILHLFRSNRLVLGSPDYTYMRYESLLGRTWKYLGGAVYLAACCLLWYGAGLPFLGRNLRAPIHVGFSPNLQSWPDPFLLLVVAFLVILTGAGLMFLNHLRIGSRITLAGCTLLLPMFFYAIPLV